MLDPSFIRENLAAVKANCANRNVRADVDRVVQLDDERRRLISETQTLQQRQNEIAKCAKSRHTPIRSLYTSAAVVSGLLVPYLNLM